MAFSTTATAAMITLTLSSLCVEPAQDTAGPCRFTPLIEAHEGEDVTLQCCMVPRINLKSSTVEWKRVDLNKLVHVYRHRKDDPDLQMEQYRSRTTLNHEDLSRGILTLVISAVQQSDSGKYRCFVPQQQTTSFIDLNVTKNQHNMIMNDDFSTMTPQLENVTKPNNPDAEKDVGAIVGGVCGGLFALVLVFTLLVKCGKIKKCWPCTQETRPDVRMANDLQLEHLTNSRDNGQALNGATVNGFGRSEQADY